jgi:cyanate permease
LKPFVRNPTPSQVAPLDGRLTGALKRVGWRMAAVGPWGFGFLVWAYVGGEV